MGDFINIHEAKAKLSSLVARAERGEEIVLARRGVAVARIVHLRGDVDESLRIFDALRAQDSGETRSLDELQAAAELGRP